MKNEHKLYAWTTIILGLVFVFMSVMAMIEAGGDSEIGPIGFLGGIITTVIGVIYLFRINSDKEFEKIVEKDKKRKASITVVKTHIVGSDSKIKTGSAVGRAVIGDLVAGGVGSIVGVSTAQKDGMTKFLVEYADGHKTMETVKDNSARFKELVKYLDI